MVVRGKTLGILISAAPEAPTFGYALNLAGSALGAGVTVYVYCIDEAITGVGDARLQELRARGLHLYACAQAARHRGLPLTDHAVFAGLSVVSDLMGATDRFLAFN